MRVAVTIVTVESFHKGNETLRDKLYWEKVYKLMIFLPLPLKVYSLKNVF